MLTNATNRIFATLQTFKQVVI